MGKDSKPVPAVRRMLAVCAHPYDATFALGGVIGAFTNAGTSVHILCLTHGRHRDPDPRRRLDRARDLGRATRYLGAHDVTLLDHAPGTLTAAGVDQLADDIVAAGRDCDAILTVDATGTDAHPDHIRTMRAAYRAATKLGSPLYAWTLSAPRPGFLRQVLVIDADRDRQRTAITCHTGLPPDDPLRRRWLQHQQREDRLIVLRTEHALASVAYGAEADPAGAH